MELQALIDEARHQLGDESVPFLWSNDALLKYAVDAQDMYVRLTGGIPDSRTVALTEVAVVENEPYSDHSPYILRIRSGKLLTAKRPVKFLQEADLQSMPVQDYGITFPQWLDDTVVGEVRAGILGVEKNAIRWYRVPNADDTCQLNILRLPYPRITDTDGCLEIDEQHHLHLVMWMKHLAYSKEDGETYDEKLAATNKEAFERYCAMAKVEEERQRYRPRVTQYGGIPW